MAHELAIQFPGRDTGAHVSEGFRPATEMIGTSLALKGVMAQLELVAPTNATVLLLGETGTGKELAARAIHRCLHRRPRAAASGVIFFTGSTSFRSHFRP